MGSTNWNIELPFCEFAVLEKSLLSSVTATEKSKFPIKWSYWKTCFKNYQSQQAWVWGLFFFFLSPPPWLVLFTALGFACFRFTLIHYGEKKTTTFSKDMMCFQLLLMTKSINSVKLLPLWPFCCRKVHCQNIFKAPLTCPKSNA